MLTFNPNQTFPPTFRTHPLRQKGHSPMLDSPLISDITPCVRHEIHIIDHIDRLTALRDDWQGLMQVAAPHPLYMTYAYGELAISNALMHKGTGIVILVYRDADLMALFPLTVRHRMAWRVGETISCGNGEKYGEMLLSEQADEAVIAVAMQALRAVPADVVIMPYLEEQGWMQRALEPATLPWLIPPRIGRRHGHAIRLRDTNLDEYWQSRSSMLRRNLKRYYKQLCTQGRVEIGWCTDPIDTDRVLTWIFDTKRRW